MAKTVKTINPATEKQLEELELASPPQVEQALARSRDRVSALEAHTLSERSMLMRAVARQLRDEEAALARHATLEMGKPIAQARAEIQKCARTCDYFAEHAASMLEDQLAPSDAAESYVSFDPLGTVLAVMPWNFPYWQVIRAAAPALMAGNVMLLKHALNVSRCAVEIEAVFGRAGAPAGLFQTLLLEHGEVPALLGDERIVAATLTGSERAGVTVAREAGSQIKRTVLELGGSDPFIVLADADIEAAAQTAAKARFQNTGQSCIAAKRFFVEAPVAEAFNARFAAAVRALRTGDPLRDDVDLGPLARADLRDELDRQVRASIEAGARVLVGGKPVPGKGYYYEPTILIDVPESAPALREETFGPVAAVVTVKDADEAIERANDSRFGLSSNLWTRDLVRAKRLARELAAGGVFINGMTASDARLPFGGIKKSGYGRELSAFGLREFTNIKTVSIGLLEAKTSVTPAWTKRVEDMGASRAVWSAFVVVALGCAEPRPNPQRLGAEGAAATPTEAEPSSASPRFNTGELAAQEYAAERDQMVEAQLVKRGITDRKVLAAMRKVPRHRFVLKHLEGAAYEDGPLPIVGGQTISQPYIVAFMSAAARAGEAQRCLEIGTGSGYQAAILAELCAETYSIEYLPEVAEFGRRNLESLGYLERTVQLRVGDGYAGWPERAPFQAILVTAAPERVPAPLLEQLAIGGRLVIPVGQEREQQMEIWTRRAAGNGPDAFTRDEAFGVRFVPFLGPGGN